MRGGRHDFRTSQLALMRSGWIDDRAAFLVVNCLADNPKFDGLHGKAVHACAVIFGMNQIRSSGLRER